jgi:ribose-phosphate pyrophosphokinase
MASEVKIFSGTATRYLSERIAHEFGAPLGDLTIQKFSDGEMEPYFNESVRGDFAFIIQSTFAPAENLLELLLTIDAAKRASAKQIVVVIPYFGYARQDRKDRPRVSIGAKLVANLLTSAGASRIVTMDLHADQIQGFFDIPLDHLHSSAVFIPELKRLALDNLSIAAPDMGGARRARFYAMQTMADMILIDKHRERANQVKSMEVIGEVAGKNVVIVDDIIDTGGTLCKAADHLMNQGAKSVRAMITHPILSGSAIDKIEASQLTELIVTDTIPQSRESEKIRVLSISKVFADAFDKIANYESISSLFINS